ncbi:MAG: hypothetical protein GY774_00280 [Planctomycetes bacterium]|nr:hypothetical protein [Planctomycetota bacterium]
MAITADFSPAFVDATEFDMIEFRADNIEGVEVVGCPLGKTYYKETTAGAPSIQWPGSSGDVVKEEVRLYGTSGAGAENVISGIETFTGSQIIQIVERQNVANNLAKIQLKKNGVVVFDTGWISGYTSLNNFGKIFNFTITIGSPTTGTSYDFYIDGTAWAESTDFTIPFSYTGEADFYTDDIRIRANGSGTSIGWDSYIVGDGLPNQCTGETQIFDAEWKLSSSGAVVGNGAIAGIKMFRPYDSDSIVGVITSGGDSLESDPIPLAVWDGKTNELIQGGSAVDLSTAYKNKARIELDMDRALDAGGLVHWLDYGKETDNYTGSFYVETEDAQALEQMICSGSADNVLITTPCENGLYPFGMGFSTGQNYPVNVSKASVSGNVDIFGTARGYKYSFMASDNPYGNLTESTAIDSGGCIDEAWLLGGVDIPFSEWGNTLNVSGNVVQTFGGSSNTAQATRDYGDTSEIKINCGEEQARRIIQYICKTMRGNTVIANLGDYKVFGRRYEALTSCTCRLYSNILTIEQQGQNSVNINFTLQMVGE